MTTLIWFRDDLRIIDHPALSAAVDAGDPVIALFLREDESPGIRPLGGAACWWLHGALEDLAEQLDELGIPLVLRSGSAVEEVPRLASETSAGLVHWTRRGTPGAQQIDAEVRRLLEESDVEVHSHPGALLHQPWELLTGQGGPYKVFTPFWNRLWDSELRPALPAAGPSPRADGPASESLVDWALRPSAPDWAEGLRETWDPTAAGASERLHDFLEHADYEAERDHPDIDGTSRLSPYLRFGQLSPTLIWETAGQELGAKAVPYQRQLAWRDFAWHLTHHFGELQRENLKPEFDRYPWLSAKQASARFRAWTTGETGIDLVDAGQKQLWRTGWMHNRVRMASASFLVKNLGIHWREGEAWFWDTLVDADAANNPMGWQWVAGSGPDASPFFRIFNPERQADRFDARGRYRQRWLGDELRPEPIVDLKETRAEALEAYQEMRG